MTPPHIEKAARAIFPAPFQNWQAVFSGWLEMGRDETEASHKADLAHGNAVKDAIERATLVWSLARAHTIEEAAKRAENWSDAQHIAHDMRTGVFPKQTKVHDAIAAAIRALAVEG